MKFRFLSFFFSLLVVSALAAKPPITTVYIVRHAEKDLTPGVVDPALTPAGEARAQLLAKKLAKRKLVALFTTDTRRARATLDPLAQATKLVPQVYNSLDPDALAIRIYKEFAGQAVVVVGHSNTLLPLLTAFGVQAPMTEIKDTEFAYLFKVELRNGQPTKLTVSKYGKE